MWGGRRGFSEEGLAELVQGVVCVFLGWRVWVVIIEEVDA